MNVKAYKEVRGVVRWRYVHSLENVTDLADFSLSGGFESGDTQSTNTLGRWRRAVDAIFERDRKSVV